VIADYEPMQSGRIEKGDAGFPLTRVARVKAESDADGIEAIVRRLVSEGVPYADLVLLLRRIRGNQKLFAELAARGIGVAVSASAAATADDGLDRLINLWIWACEPWQRLRAARVAVDFGGAESDPRASLDRVSETLVSPMKSGESLSCEELLALLERAFELRQRFGALYAQFELFVLKHQAQGLSPAVLARKLHLKEAREEEVAGFVPLAPPANLSGSIRALTVHAAKGLEFPVVILADLKNRRTRGSAVMRHKEELWLLARDDDGALDKDAPGVKEAAAESAAAAVAESGRLLYVAMTRAREALYAVETPSTKPETGSWSEWISTGVGEALLSDELTRELAPPAANAREHAVPTSENLLEAEPPSYRKARVGATELASGEAEPKSAPRELRTALSPAGAVDARALGTDIHACLEHGDWAELGKLASRAGIDLSKFNSFRETAEGRAVFGERARREFAFEWAHPQGIVAGRIDCLVEREDGELWIVDYKVLLGRRNSAELVADYAPQMKIYAGAVKTLTKAPRVRTFLVDVACATGQIWHEVPPKLA
jgi:ATP-dependent exoDNAse (exonuclease V) beta subunit